MPPGTLSLKQRLAALAQSTTSPSTYSSDAGDSLTSLRSTIRRKAQTHAPWLRRQEEPLREPTAAEVGQVEHVLSKMIFQAGVDYEYVSKQFRKTCTKHSTIYLIQNSSNVDELRHLCLLGLILDHRVVLNASALPDPDMVSYDLLLSCVRFLQSSSICFEMTGNQAYPGIPQSIW